MGLFGPPKDFREHKFTMPCTPHEAISVIAAAEDFDGSRPFGILINNYVGAQDRGEPVGQPPLAETIYLESLGDDGLTIAAGNRTHTSWRMQLVLTGSNPVNGSFGATEVNNDQWIKNIWQFNSALSSAVGSVGGKKGKWPGSF